MDFNFLIRAIVVLIVVGMLLWCVRSIPGIPAPIPVVLQILIVLGFAVWLLNHSGFISSGVH